jgi:putative peptide zinc metalloprotease protein
VVPQGDEDMVRNRTRRVEIRPVERISDVIPAHVLREVPAATDELPSMTLSLQGGGKIGLDPSKMEGDNSGAKALEKLFVLDLGLPEGTQLNHLGSRIYVRFEHQPEPLAYQWYRGVRRVFLKKFHV